MSVKENRWAFVPPQIRRAVDEMPDEERAILKGRDRDARPSPEVFERMLREQRKLSGGSMSCGDFLELACEADLSAADAYNIAMRVGAL